MGSQEFLGNVPAIWIALGLLVLMLAVHEIAFRSGVRFLRKAPEKVAAGGRLADSALSLLLGLFLAFSFSLAAGRYEQRQELVIAESNAIGTAFLRCDLMADDARQACRSYFKKYTELRIEIYEVNEPDQLKALTHESEEVQGALWAMFAQVAREAPSTNTSLTLQAMNEVIDRHGERVAAFRRHVPGLVTAMLLCLCLTWAMFNGYSQGMLNSRNPLAWPAFAVLISMVIYIIFDFDRQSAGIIQLDASRSLYDLRASME